MENGKEERHLTFPFPLSNFSIPEVLEVRQRLFIFPFELFPFPFGSNQTSFSPLPIQIRSMKHTLLFLLLLIATALPAQKKLKVVPGVGIGNIYPGKQTAGEIMKRENDFVMKYYRFSGGSTAMGYDGISMVTDMGILGGGLSVSFRYTENPSNDSLLNAANAKQPVFSVTIRKDAENEEDTYLAIDANGNLLFDKTPDQIRKLYAGYSFLPYTDYSGNQMLIDRQRGICFMFDESKKCTAIEVFLPNGFCYNVAFDEGLFRMSK